ncbi:peptidase domain-containing ABC transporter [Escherichia coli]|uniref:peptidase domain-containing ABC transporter n=1 Tax=Escherichia coli TaxID=562 RepID=UPI000D13D5A7|nr:peptidase domain-containing ABC transporter [Escherichia coli]EEQ1544488.1 peptidase domain-containing ABC transporter [Escherichia coli]EEQ2265103.1 peptidase domain-containing ABC transporter [Escherichia coli]EEQ8441243.1 peptidase domain-containing ABC transporter [Escherichia coli]EER0129613.1 peptidase domain-containing ABC transporter [Escherichia coli]EER2993148.1 peptidase domain-containing ABC transporter [Escherichia coli]
MIIDKLNFKVKRAFPFYFQNENSDCALTCIRMLACYYGKEGLLENVLDKLSSKKNEWAVSDIVSVLRSLGIMPRAVSLNIDELNCLSLPCILHWNMNHFVVLVKRKRNKYVVHDPDKGIQVLSLQKISESFTGVGIEVYNDGSIFYQLRKDKKRNKTIYNYILSVFFLGKNVFFCLFILIFLAELINITIPQITQLVIDNVIVNDDYQLLVTAVIFYLFLNAVSIGILATRDWLIIWLNANISVQWATNAYNRLISLRMKYFSSRSVGDILSRVNSLEYIRNVVISQLTKVLLDFFMAIGAFIIMCSYSPVLTFVVFFSSLLYFLLKVFYFSSLKYLNLGTIRVKARQQSALIESIKYNQTIKLYFQEYTTAGIYENSLIEGINIKTKMDLLNIVLSSSSNLLSAVKNISILYFGGLFVINSSFTIGMLVAFIAYSEQFSRRVTNMIDFFIQLGVIRIHISRVSDISDADYEKIPFTLSGKDTHGAVGIECVNLSMKYHGREVNVLTDVNLKIYPGETVLLRGKSGGGKTSLLYAILGLVELSGGHIIFTDGDKNNKIEDIRSVSGTVLQGDILLNGTIIYNITFNDSTPSPELLELTKKIGIHDIIERLPMGYFTPVNDAGNILSAGQKQKILLARALFRKPKLLILDEATSNLDAESEYEINQVILSLDCTKIIVSHKDDVLSATDKIINIEGGRVKEISLSGDNKYKGGVD